MDGAVLSPKSNELYIGIDIGGTSTRIGLFRALSSPNYVLLARFPTFQNYEQQLEALNRTLQKALEEHQFTLLSPRYMGIGVSIGARLAKDGRAVLVAPNMPAYEGRPFALDLEQRFSCPVRLAHDGVCGLLGEAQFGVLASCERAAYLTVSTGTGAAIRLHNEHTTLTLSIEIGHQLLDGNPLVCLCGQIGCLETHTGGRQLALRLGEPTEAIADPAFWDLFASKLALGLINLTHLTHVEVIAVSGAIALNHPFLLTLLQQKIHAQLRNASLELRRARLEEDAPLIGAAQLLLQPDGSIMH